MAHTFVLSFGYAEESIVSYMAYTTEQEFPNDILALKDLADFLKEKYLDTEEGGAGQSTPKECCVKTQSSDKDAVFCCRCAAPLNSQFEFDLEMFEQWVKSFGGSTLDYYHSNIIPYDEDDRWDLENYLEEAPNPVFVYEAEKVIAAAVDEDPEDFKSICRDRAESGKRRFSYYA